MATSEASIFRCEGTPGQEIVPLTTDRLSIGRARENDLQIRDDAEVSRRHCRLLNTNGLYYIQDLHSCNGTIVDGAPIFYHRVYGGEEIRIGQTSLRFRLTPSA
jgi:pSer/pThr/pTyr-binding forkhead associated (FHA) protein